MFGYRSLDFKPIRTANLERCFVMAVSQWNPFRSAGSLVGDPSRPVVTGRSVSDFLLSCTEMSSTVSSIIFNPSDSVALAVKYPGVETIEETGKVRLNLNLINEKIEN